MSLIRVLQSELRSLSVEAGRKYPLIKDAADRGIRQLRSIQEKSGEDNVSQSKLVRATEEIAKPFLVACESKNTKLIVISLSSLQQLLLHSAVPVSGLNIIVETVARLCENNAEEAVLLKILQLGLTIFTSNEYELNQTTLAKLLKICFVLHTSRSMNVHFTATATIRQATTVLFDQLNKKTTTVEEQGEQVPTSETISTMTQGEDNSLFSNAKNTFLFLKDLCHFMEGQPGQWLMIDKISPSFTLELLETILSAHSPLLLRYDQFVKLIQEKVCPLVLKNLQSNDDRNFVVMVRVYRISISLIRYFSKVLDKQCYEFLSVICQKIDKDYQPWDKVLSLEVLRALFGKATEELILLNPNLVSSLVGAIQHCTERIAAKERTLTFNFSAKRANRLDNLTDTQPFSPSMEEMLILVLDCLLALSANVNKQVVEITWASVLETITLLMDRTEDDDTAVAILKIYEGYVNCACSSNLVTARDAFLTSLCKFAPQEVSNSEIELTRKNVLVMKTLFSIAHTMGGSLGSSWYLLLKSFQVLNTCLNYQSNKNFKLSESNQEDLVYLSSCLANLFLSTELLELDSLLIILKSLCGLSQDTIKLSQSSTMISGSTSISHSRLFAASKLVETVQINTHRIADIWGLFSAHVLNVLVDYPNDSEIRKFGVNAIMETILAVFRPDYNKYQKKKQVQDIAEVTMSAELETSIWSVLGTIFNSTHIDVRENLISSLHGLVQKCGQVMVHAWPSVLPILKVCSTYDEDMKKFITMAFKSVQIIGNDFLPNLNARDALMPYIEVVGCYSNCDAPDVNISLVAISIFMTISDFINTHYQRHDTTTMDLWLKLYNQLNSITTDPRPEVRHSALRTVTFVLASNGDQLDHSKWGVCIDIILSMLNNVHGAALRAERAESSPTSPTIDEQYSLKSSNRGKNTVKQMFVHHSRNTAAKQWSETRSLAIESVSRILKEHGSRWNEMDLEVVKEAVNQIIEFIRQSTQTGTSEIAKTTVRHLQEMLEADQLRPEIKDILWKSSLEIWFGLAESASSGAKFIENNTVTALLEGIGELYDKRPQLFNQEDIAKLLQLLKMFLTCQIAMDVIMHPSVIQKACFVLLRKLVTFSQETYRLAFDLIVSLLPTEQEIDNLIDRPNGNVLIPVKFANSLQKELVYLLQGKRDMWLDVIHVLGYLVKTRFIVWQNIDTTSAKWLSRAKVPFYYPLWMNTVKLIDQVVTSNLPLEDPNPQIWTELVTAFSNFLFYDQVPQDMVVKEDSSDEETGQETKDRDVMVIRLIETVCLPNSKTATEETKHKLIDIIARASEMAPRPLAEESLLALFRLVTKGSEVAVTDEQAVSVQVGRCVVPVLLQRCREIMRKYIVEDQRTGKCPLPRYKREEVQLVMTQLKSLSVHSALYTELEQLEASKKKQINRESLCGPRGILVRMLPVLCEFITCCDDSMRGDLLETFRLVNSELGLADEEL